jgi:hypothetical protein
MAYQLRKKKTDPEEKIVDDITDYLLLRGWIVKRTHGSMFQSGFADLYATHSKYGGRWIEVKLPDMKGSKFTAAQLEWFPKFAANGTGIWILTAATETEYNKLFKPCNLWGYLLEKA